MPACNFSAVQYNGHFIALFDIRSARNDLDRFAADIYLTDDQLVGIRMLLYFLDLTDHDLFQISIQSFIGFHLGSRQCHDIRIFLIRTGQFGYICLNP